MLPPASGSFLWGAGIFLDGLSFTLPQYQPCFIYGESGNLTMSLISELRRRNVFRAALLYVVSSWFIAQLTSLAFSGGELAWVHRFTCGLLVICFPLLMVFSYIYEITPQGIRKEYEVAREHSITRRTGRRITRLTKWVFIIALGLQISRWLLA